MSAHFEVDIFPEQPLSPDFGDCIIVCIAPKGVRKSSENIHEVEQFQIPSHKRRKRVKVRSNPLIFKELVHNTGSHMDITIGITHQLHWGIVRPLDRVYNLITG